MTTSRWIPAVALLLASVLAAAPPAESPRNPVDFTVNLTGGKTLTLSQYRGKAVVLAFILTYCGHCQATVGILSKLQKEYGPKGLQVIASAVEPNAGAAVPLFMRNYQPAFPVGFNTGESAHSFIKPTGKLPQMPLLAFIDKQGVIRAQHEGEEPFFQDLEKNLRGEIEALLKTPISPNKK